MPLSFAIGIGLLCLTAVSHFYSLRSSFSLVTIRRRTLLATDLINYITGRNARSMFYCKWDDNRTQPLSCHGVGNIASEWMTTLQWNEKREKCGMCALPNNDSNMTGNIACARGRTKRLEKCIRLSLWNALTPRWACLNRFSWRRSYIPPAS